MSKPAAYTIQLTKKANGVLQMRLMIPGFEAIVMRPTELRDVAEGIEAMFGRAVSARPQAPTMESLQEQLQALSEKIQALERKKENITAQSAVPAYWASAALPSMELTTGLQANLVQCQEGRKEPEDSLTATQSAPGKNQAALGTRTNQIGPNLSPEQLRELSGSIRQVRDGQIGYARDGTCLTDPDRAGLVDSSDRE